MYSSNVAFARSIRPMIKPRLFSSLPSSLGAPRVLALKTLTPSRILSATPVPFASDTVVNPEDKIRRTDGDDDLLRVLQEVAPLEVESPKDSPFVVTDGIAGNKSIWLEREFQGEKIEVSAFRSSFRRVVDEDKSEQDAAEGPNTDDDRQPCVGLYIIIAKAGLTLSFTGLLYNEDFKIRNMMLQISENVVRCYAGPRFCDLDEGLQRALTEYMGARGVNVSLCRFLWEYFMKVDDKKYFMEGHDEWYRVWFMNLKEFVEKWARFEKNQQQQ